jgi:hypothetical protein
MPLSLNAQTIPLPVRLAAARAVVEDISTTNPIRGLKEWPEDHKDQQAKSLACGQWGGELSDSTANRVDSFYRVLCALGYRNNLMSWEIPVGA